MLENDNTNSEQTYAKQLFSRNSGHTKILGLGWNKITDKINIDILQFSKRQRTKTNVLSYIASIYDPFGLISASHIIGILIYHELCDLKFLGMRKSKFSRIWSSLGITARWMWLMQQMNPFLKINGVYHKMLGGRATTESANGQDHPVQSTYYCNNL